MYELLLNYLYSCAFLLLFKYFSVGKMLLYRDTAGYHKTQFSENNICENGPEH